MVKMIYILLDMLKFIVALLGVILSPFIVVLLILLFIFFFNILHLRFFKRMIRMKDDRKIEKKSILYRLFVEFPKQKALDYMNADPYDFKEYGLHMFCGAQGCGKTIAVTKKLMDLKSEYPKAIIRTNMAYKHEDESLLHWKQMVENTNGKYGQVEVLDEIQNWFNSNDSKNFPYEMLTEISQQRKQRKMLIGTAQVFSRIAKPIREQVTFVYLPQTYFGCLTIVKRTRPEYWDNEKQEFKKYEGRYFFVHSDEIRNAYDTYKKIRRYSDVGFQQREIISNEATTQGS